MLKLVKETTNGKGFTKTYFDKKLNVFVKEHFWLDEEYLIQHDEFMKKYYSGILIDKVKKDNRMLFTYKAIEGVNSKEVVKDVSMLTKLYRFILNELDRTWPYYHNDWSVSNILFHKNKFYLIDWSDIEKGASKAECISKINRDLREGFGEKLWASWIITDDATKLIKEYNNV